MSTIPKNLTKHQVALLKEALGIGGSYPFYRNFSSVSLVEEKEIDEAWRDLVEKGFAQVVKEPCHRLRCRVYAATDEGKRLISDLTGIIPFMDT